MTTNDFKSGVSVPTLNEPEPAARKFNSKSTQTAAQYERIRNMLRTGTRSTFDFRKAGIMAPAARIKEMNDKHGYNIPTIALRDLWDDEGYCHPRVAVYELIDEPHGERP